MGVKVIIVALFCVSAVLGGIKIPRDDCEWRAGGEGDMANRCDGDQLVVGACGSGFNADCPGTNLNKKFFDFVCIFNISYTRLL